MPAMDPYEVLQVDRHAEPDVIRAAYRVLARKNHPDAGGSAERMATLNAGSSVMRASARVTTPSRSEAAPRPSPSSGPRPGRLLLPARPRRRPSPDPGPPRPRPIRQRLQPSRSGSDRPPRRPRAMGHEVSFSTSGATSAGRWTS